MNLLNLLISEQQATAKAYSEARHLGYVEATEPETGLEDHPKYPQYSDISSEPSASEQQVGKCPHHLMVECVMAAFTNQPFPEEAQQYVVNTDKNLSAYGNVEHGEGKSFKSFHLKIGSK